MTGHDNGIITLSLVEADDAMREQLRVAMGEPYRTLLGHSAMNAVIFTGTIGAGWRQD